MLLTMMTLKVSSLFPTSLKVRETTLFTLTSTRLLTAVGIPTTLFISIQILLRNPLKNLLLSLLRNPLKNLLLSLP